MGAAPAHPNVASSMSLPAIFLVRSYGWPQQDLENVMKIAKNDVRARLKSQDLFGILLPHCEGSNAGIGFHALQDSNSL